MMRTSAEHAIRSKYGKFPAALTKHIQVHGATEKFIPFEPQFESDYITFSID